MVINPYEALNLIKEAVRHIDKVEKEAIDNLAYHHNIEENISIKAFFLSNTIKIIQGIEEIESEILNLIYMEK